jgi:hypothetical protein
MIFKFFQLELKQPTRGDWVSTCLKDLKQLRFVESLEEIKIMSKDKFKNKLKMRIKENALKYLVEKRGCKGQEI